MAVLCFWCFSPWMLFNVNWKEIKEGHWLDCNYKGQSKLKSFFHFVNKETSTILSFKLWKAIILSVHTVCWWINEATTYVFSSPTMQMADSSFTTSVIMPDWAGSMARASSARLFSSPRIRSKPYCRIHKAKYAVILPNCNNKNTMSCENVTEWQSNY